MGKEKTKAASLSWFIISTRDHKEEYDWFWDKRHHCCYGMPKDKRTDCVPNALWEHYINWNKPLGYFDECVLMPEFHMDSIDDTKTHIIDWCNENKILYIDDLEQYKQIEGHYWDVDEIGITSVESETTYEVK